MCEECTQKRRKKKIKENINQRVPKGRKKYEIGEYVDPDKKFKFIAEVPRKSKEEHRIIVEDSEHHRFEFSVAYLLSGRVKTRRERELEKERRAYRKISQGDVIGVDGCLIAQHDLEYHTYDDYSKIFIEVYNIETDKTYGISLLTALHHRTTGKHGAIIRKRGEIVGTAGVTFVEWCDENGSPIAHGKQGGIVSDYARFKCSCKEHTEFIARWTAVRDSRRQCPSCMSEREKESRRKNGAARRIKNAA